MNAGRRGGILWLTGSSEIRVGEPSRGQDHSESVVGGVAEAAGDPPVEFDDAVDRFGAAVVGAAGGEVGEELFAPGPEGAAESGDLGDRAGGERVEGGDRDLSALGQVGRVVGGAELLVAAPRYGDLVVRVAGGQPGFDPLDLAGGQPVGSGPEYVADLVERVVFAAPVSELILLDPASGLLHGLQSKLHHVEGVEHGGRVFEFVTDRVAVTAERIQGGGADPGRESVLAGT